MFLSHHFGKRGAALLIAIETLCAPTAFAQTSAKPAAPAHHKKTAKSAASSMRSVKDLKKYIASLKKAAAQREKETTKETKTVAALDRKQDDDEAAGTDYLEAYLYYLQQRAYPRNTIDPQAHARALAQRSRMRPARIGAAGAPGAPKPLIVGGNWQFVGPKNLAIPYQIYYGNGPLSGRVNSFVFDPTAAGTYYLASMGGVWKTTDSGVTWTPLSDSFPDLKIGSLAIDPSNPSTVYAGTGDYDGSLGYPYGIMKTTDGGATWTNYGKADFGGSSVSSIVVDPETTSLVTLSSGRGTNAGGYVWRSTNGGVNWTKVINTETDWSDLKVGAKDTNGLRYYYATGDNGNIWISADRGATWTQLSTAMLTGTPGEMKIAPSILDAKTVYLMDTANKMLYKSADAGANWTNITAGFPGDSSPGDNYNWTQNTYDKALICSSQTVGGVTTDVLYASLIDMDQYYFDTPSATYKWRSVGQAYTSNAVLHNDQHALVVNPNDPNTLLVGCDGGAYRLTYTPSATTAGSVSYDSLNAGLGITQYYKAAYHPTDATRMVGGAQDNGSPTSIGDLSAYKNFGGGDGGFSAVNFTTPNTQYTTSQKLAVYVTTDGWANNTEIDPPFGMEKPAFIAPIFLDQKTPQYLYGGTNYLYRYDQTTEMWSSHIGGAALASSGNYIAYITVAPSDSNRIYTGSSTGEVYMSTDFGATFKKINTGSPSLPNRAITYLAVDPTNPNRLFVTVGGSGSGHVFLCANTTAAGRIWMNISGAGAGSIPDINTNTIALDTDAPNNTYYIGNDVGVFMTTNGGATWTNATNPLGLPNVQVNELAVIPGQRALYAATFGRGIWKINLATSYSVSGKISLEGIANPAATVRPVSPVTFVFTPVGGGPLTIVTQTLGALGAYTITGLTPGSYNMSVKGDKWLRSTIPVNASAGSVGGINLTLRAGDANNDNSVDSTDFGILIGAYGGVYNPANLNNGYDPTADFNNDGSVDSTDFGLLISEFNAIGSN